MRDIGFEQLPIRGRYLYKHTDFNGFTFSLYLCLLNQTNSAATYPGSGPEKLNMAKWKTTGPSNPKGKRGVSPGTLSGADRQKASERMNGSPHRRPTIRRTRTGLPRSQGRRQARRNLSARPTCLRVCVRRSGAGGRGLRGASRSWAQAQKTKWISSRRTDRRARASIIITALGGR